MKYYEVDLYEYYKVKKPEGGKAILHCYIKQNSVEIESTRKNPAMLALPGGGYCFCSFREAEPIALRFLGYGFNAFWLDYSISPVKYPYSITEAIMAMNYIREHAEEHNTDKDKVSAIGFSAGGHLCALLGTYYDNEDSKKIFSGKENARPDAIILSYPVITSTLPTHSDSFVNLCGDDKELIKKLSIEKLVNSKSSPAFIWSTCNDGCVPIRNSLVVAEAYANAGVKFSVHIFGSGLHGLSTADDTVFGKQYYNYKNEMSTSTPEWVSLAIEWLDENSLYIR